MLQPGLDLDQIPVNVPVLRPKLSLTHVKGGLETCLHIYTNMKGQVLNGW